MKIPEEMEKFLVTPPSSMEITATTLITSPHDLPLSTTHRKTRSGNEQTEERRTVEELIPKGNTKSMTTSEEAVELEQEPGSMDSDNPVEHLSALGIFFCIFFFFT